MELVGIVVAAAFALAVVLFWAWRPDPQLAIVSRVAEWLANTLNTERAATMAAALIVLTAVSMMHSCSTNDIRGDVAQLSAEQTRRFAEIDRTQAAQSVTLDALLRGQPRPAAGSDGAVTPPVQTPAPAGGGVATDEEAGATTSSTEVLEAISALRADVRDLRRQVEAPAKTISIGAGWFLLPALFLFITSFAFLFSARVKAWFWSLAASLALTLVPTLELALKNQFTLERLFDLDIDVSFAEAPPPPPPNDNAAPPRVTGLVCDPAWRIGDFTPNAVQAFSDGGSFDGRVARVLEALRADARWNERAAIVLIGSADTMRRSRPNAELAATRAQSVRTKMLEHGQMLALPPILVLNSDDLEIVRMAVGPRETLTGREVRVCLATAR